MSDTQGPGAIHDKIQQWYRTELRQRFINKLKVDSEGNGTVFRPILSFVVSVKSSESGNVHSHTRVPFLLAGSAVRILQDGRLRVLPSGTFTITY